MHEFETFVYLDVQKTGSSFIASVLKRFSREKLVRKVLHVGVGANYDATKFHFISVRDPFELYLSLYSFGCQRKGKLFTRLCKRGFENLYNGTASGFSSWLKFILDPESSAYLPGYGEGHLKDVSSVVGFQSYRVLQLAMRNAEQILATCKDSNDVRSAFKSNNIVQYTVRTERLRADLVDLLATKLARSIRDIEKARCYVVEESARNKSRRVDEAWQLGGTEAQLRALTLDREWPLREFYGY
jgi:hypothetical protein